MVRLKRELICPYCLVEVILVSLKNEEPPNVLDVRVRNYRIGEICSKHLKKGKK